MPDLYGPFDNSSWSQAQWYRYAPTWAPSGVVGSAAAATSASVGPLGLTFSGLDLTLSLGRAWVYGAGYERTGTPWTGTVPVNTSTNARVDALVLRRDLAAKTVTPVILQGTPAATPVAPTRQSDELGQWDLPLFSWTTPANSGSPITNVTEQRVFVDTQTGYGFSGGGGQIKAYGSMNTTQSLTTGNARILGGLNVPPSLLPGRLYEYELGGHTLSASITFRMTVRAIAGSTAPTTSNGTIIAGHTYQPANVNTVVPVLTGKFTVGTAGVYTLSPFGYATSAATFGPSDVSPAGITVVIRDAGPSVGVVGTTPIAVP